MSSAVPEILISRGSNLARAQVQEFLQRFAQMTEPCFALRYIESQGDKEKQRPLLEAALPSNFFTRELDEALLSGEADWALHSAKDLPKPIPQGLKLWALLAPETAEQTDSLISLQGWTLQELPQGAKVGTSSANRKQQLLELRPDLEIVSIRGTIEERAACVANGDLHAVVMATCAIQRLPDFERRLGQKELPIQVHPLQGYLAVVGRPKKNEAENEAKNATAQILKKLDVRQNWGSVVLVGAGAGAPDLLTLKGQRILQQADVVFYDALVGKEMLDFAARAEKIYVGKRRADHSMPQDKICRLLWQEARQGKQVVRLKGGDALLFARAAEEFQALDEALVSYRVLPGISAAFAAAASLALPLTQRGDDGSSLHLLSAYPPERIDFQSLPRNGNIVFYMGLSQRQVIKERALAAGRRLNDPALVVIWASLPEQQNLYTTLAELPDLRFDKKAAGLIMLGPIARTQQRKANSQKDLLMNREDVKGKTWVTGLSRDMDPETPPEKVWHLPLLQLTERSESKLLAALAECDLLLFTSKYAVRYFFAKLQRNMLDVRILADKNIVSIGRATSRELENFGLRLREPGDWQSPEESSKGLVAEFARRKLCGRRILIPSSDKALPVLTQELPKPENGGHTVKRVVLYENTLPEALRDLEIDKLVDLKAVFLSSPSTAEHFAELLAKPLFARFGAGFPRHWEYRCKGGPTRERLTELQAKYSMLDWQKELR